MAHCLLRMRNPVNARQIINRKTMGKTPEICSLISPIASVGLGNFKDFVRKDSLPFDPYTYTFMATTHNRSTFIMFLRNSQVFVRGESLLSTYAFRHFLTGDFNIVRVLFSRK